MIGSTAFFLLVLVSVEVVEGVKVKVEVHEEVATQEVHEGVAIQAAVPQPSPSGTGTITTLETCTCSCNYCNDQPCYNGNFCNPGQSTGTNMDCDFGGTTCHSMWSDVWGCSYTRCEDEPLVQARVMPSTFEDTDADNSGLISLDEFLAKQIAISIGAVQRSFGGTEEDLRATEDYLRAAGPTLFNSYDSDQDGSWTQVEYDAFFAEAYQGLMPMTTPTFEDTDADNSGLISLDEFLPKQIANYRGRLISIGAIFAQDGAIFTEESLRAGEELIAQSVTHSFNEYDIDQDGSWTQVEYDAYINMLTQYYGTQIALAPAPDPAPAPLPAPAPAPAPSSSSSEKKEEKQGFFTILGYYLEDIPLIGRLLSLIGKILDSNLSHDEWGHLAQFTIKRVVDRLGLGSFK